MVGRKAYKLDRMLIFRMAKLSTCTTEFAFDANGESGMRFAFATNMKHCI
jgi:hypothetical protein